MPDAAAVWYWVDLNWLVQLLATALVISFALFHLLRTAATKIMIIHDHDHDQQQPHTNNNHMDMDDKCVVCGDLSTKQCSACKLVRYCSTACQRSHWKSGHKGECKDFQSFGKCNSKQGSFVQNGRKSSKGVALVPGRVHSNGIKPLREILFPYEDFLELYNWDKAGFPPCGLLNCGNSCFANVILQCLSSTRPLVAYLLEKGHQRECRRNDWCFLCELQIHIQRASTSRQPFSPLNILSRLPNIGGNLGYGKQEDAHEFMRFAIDAMQSVCLDEFGGEKVLQHSTQETTLIQHIFGGHLQSQVVCSKCCNVSNQRENMMELNVEIHGDAASLEECLDQFTAREQLHGDNMYKCDSCNDYVMAWKRLMVQRAPNILTIALKRFQSGRFGKLNKRVTFPETLDLSPYMIEQNDGNDVYKLYAVVVHVDMLNASFFGHYICYTKDFHGNWYRIDDCKVSKVDLEEVLSEGAYMLLYSRVSPRPSCLKPIGTSSKKEQQAAEVIPVEKMASEEESVESLSRAESSQSISTNSEHNDSVQMDVPLSTVSDDVAMDDTISSPSLPQDMSVSTSQDFKKDIASVSVQMDVHPSTVSDDVAMTHTIFCPSVPQDMPVSSSQDFEKDIASVSVQTDVRPSTVSNDVAMTDTISCPSVPQDMPVSSSQDFEKDIASVSVQMDVRPSIVSDDVAMTDTISSPSLPQDISVPTSQDSEKDIAFVSLQTDGLESVHLESEISSNELMSSSLDNSQCSEDVNNVPLSPTDFKRQPEKLETGNGSPSSNGGKFALKANGAKVKPFLKPGFLGKRPSNNSTKRRGKCVASNVSGFSLASTNDVHKPQPE